MYRTLLTGALAAALSAPLPLAVAAEADTGADAGTSAEADLGAADHTYYADAEGETGEALKTALHEIISADVTRLSYSQVWDALKETDQDPSDPGSVILLYSGESRGADQNGGNVGDWNREHVWAQSHGDFGTSAGPGTDIHHLRPTDVQVNSTRGNKDFDNGGSPVASAPGNFTDADSWEARDEDKGDIARMLFYMAVRYEGDDGFADLELDDDTSNGGTPFHGRLSTLLEWHAQDPPSASEERRNEIIFTDYQGNRNPFIDHPEWAESIWG
ncbi:endonuclease I family protein [Streptomyces radicis]|uniref:Ribonuclease n=1 Tax=Streptomyces radicis TaxID=1750517 RepID=A0A3A9WAQ4_9ACTN|nr:endonuclease [Streptomyces radicis]RKN10208.1 ribonuclease [Streptomyces radicis]RKN24550.1 ribonuclease [Streptomyces radicis]